MATVQVELEPGTYQAGADAGAPISDGGLPGGEPLSIRARAEFPGGVDTDPVWACSRKDSSTDSEKPPKELGLELTLQPFAAPSP